MSAKLMSEAMVVAKTGLPVETLRLLRENGPLEKDVDWKLHHREISYTALGLSRLEKILRDQIAVTEKAPPHLADPVESAADIPMLTMPERPSVRARMVVSSRQRRVRNAVIVLAVKIGEAEPEPGKEIRVRVRTNEHFRPGMQLTARHEAGMLWIFEGKHPRANSYQHPTNWDHQRGL
jgi:hypothetical protein